MFAHAQGLEDALRTALDTHPAVSGAKAGHEAAREDVNMAVSDYYPELSVSSTVGRVYQDNSTSRGLATERGSAYSGYGEGSLALRQTIYDGMGREHRVNAARARMDSKNISVLDAQEDLILRASGAYIEVLRIRAALALLSAQQSSIQEFEDRIKQMAEDGAADEAQLQQAHDVSMIVAGVIADYQGQLLSAGAAYAEAVGEMPPTDMPTPQTLSSSILSDVGQAVSLSLQEHPALRAMDYDIKAAHEDVAVAKSGYFPQVGGELSYAKVDKKDVIGGESEDARAVLRMNWDFATGGKQKSEVDQMRYKVAQSRAQQDDLKRQIERDVLMAYARLDMFNDKSEISAQRVELNEKLFAAYETQFEGARIDLLGLMRAQSQLFNARLEDSDNKFNALGAQYGVLAAMGRLKDTLLGKGSQSASVGEEPPADALMQNEAQSPPIKKEGI